MPASTIKAGTYPGQDKDNKNTVVWNILVTNAKMSDQDAYNIVKTIFDKKAGPCRGARRGEEFLARKPGEILFADPVAPGRGEILDEHGVKM